MAKTVGAIIVGLIVGFTVTMLVQFGPNALYAPEGLDHSDPAAVDEFIASLPPMAFVLVWLSHALGSFAAGFVGSKIAQKILPALVLGAVLLVAGVMNLVFVPHPTWFAVVDLALYLPASWLGGKLAL